MPIVYDVERIRDGRSFATRRSMARQHGKPIFYLTASFHVHEEGFDHQDVMPDVAPPEECPTFGDLFRKITGRPDDDSWEREWAALDVRFAGDSRPGGPLENADIPARTRIWIKASDAVPDDQVLNTCVLTYASDLTLLGVSLVPHGLLITSPKVQPASLDHSMWFHRPVRADDWLLYDQHSPSASGARGFALGRVFCRDGRLVASVAQEGLIRPVKGCQLCGARRGRQALACCSCAREHARGHTQKWVRGPSPSPTFCYLPRHRWIMQLRRRSNPRAVPSSRRLADTLRCPPDSNPEWFNGRTLALFG